MDERAAAPRRSARRCRAGRFWSSAWPLRGGPSARLLAGRGEDGAGGRFRASRRRRQGSRASASKSFLDTDGLAQLDGTRTVVKSPGVPREAPVIAAALERGIEVVGELELAWRAIPNRFVAVTGTNGKTTDGRAARPPLPRRRRAGRGRRQRRHAALARWPARSSPTRPWSASAPASSSRTPSDFAPECAVFLNLAPDHLDRHADLESYLAAKLRIFANQGNDDVAVYNADDPALAGTDLGGCARRVAFCAGAGPDCEVAAGRGHDLLRRRAAARRSTSSACSASTTSPTRWPPPPRRSRWASTATRCARACAASPASRTGSSRSPRSAASASSTTRRRPTSPRPRSACAPSRAASTRSSAAARRASRSRRCSSRSASAAPPAT